MAYIGGDKSTITNIWRRRVQNFWLEMTQNARPSNIIRKMKPPPNRDDPVVREIITLDNDDQWVKATEKLLDYLVSDEGLQPGEIADRWLVFDVALSEAHPLLYDIVHGKIDPMVQEQQKQAVNACMGDLTNDLDPRHLYDFLVSKDLLGDTEIETLSCKGEHKGPIQSAFYMLSHLHRSANKNWYQDFVKALAESGYEELVQILNDTYEGIVSNWDANRVSGVYPPRQALSTINVTANERLQEIIRIRDRRLPQSHGSSHRMQNKPDPARFVPATPMPVQQESALCGNFQNQLSIQNTRVSSMTHNEQCPGFRGVYDIGTRLRCDAPAASPAVVQEQGNATASNGARPKEKPTANANLQAKQAPGQAAATTRRRDSMTTSRGVNAAELPAVVATPKKQQCPYCKMMVDRLLDHTCKAVWQAAPASTKHGRATGGGGARPFRVTGVRQIPQEQCPYCRRKYVNLSNHKICRPR